MEPDEVLNTITSDSSLREFVEANLLSGIPWIFQGDAALFQKWRSAVARDASVSANDIYLVGSAATGYSLSPRKPGREFRHARPGVAYPSDLDIAIVDFRLFENAWNTLVKSDRGGGLSRLIQETENYTWDEVRSDIQEMRRNVYWGTISDRHTISGTEIARVLRSLFATTTRSKPFVGHSPKARIYRRREDLVSYHEQSLQAVREALRRRGT